MGLPTMEATSEVLIEGQLTEDRREQFNVQVVVPEHSEGMRVKVAHRQVGSIRLFLVDGSSGN